jgi:HAD superfamily hydrolase (TIGR01549 family)
MADGVLLDVDGTLVDTVYLHVVAWHQAFLEYDVVVPSTRIHAAIGMGGDRLVGWVAGDEVEERSGDALRDRWEQLFDAMLDRIRPTNGAAELVRTLKGRGLRVALASSGKEKHLAVAREQLGVDDCIDAITTTDDVDSSKPDDDLLQVTADKIEARDPVMVGDAPWDAVAAAKAGMAVVLLRTGGFSDAVLREAASGDVTIVDDPAELVDRLAETPLG